MSFPAEQAQARAADVAAAVSTVAVGWSWTTANEIAQFVAACVAIASGVLAGAWHVHKFIQSRRNGAKPDSE